MDGVFQSSLIGVTGISSSFPTTPLIHVWSVLKPGEVGYPLSIAYLPQDFASDSLGPPLSAFQIWQW